MGEALALGAALCFGITDFVSALLARRVHSIAVALVAQLGGTALILVAAVAVPASSVTVGALGWGALSGVGTGKQMSPCIPRNGIISGSSRWWSR
jgi:drug/metabolite transporter (DMT)-like permease